MKFDSFGRPILCMPRLRFLEGDENGGGDGQQQTGFPADTPVAEMTQEQQLAYWQHQSRKHERRASSRADYDQLKADSEELARLRAESQTDAERDVLVLGWRPLVLGHDVDDDRGRRHPRTRPTRAPVAVATLRENLGRIDR